MTHYVNSSPSEDEIRHALSFIDSNCARDDWARIGMAIKSELGDAGFTLFDDWSQSGDSYCKKSCSSTWKSIKASGAGNSVKIATLFSMAKQFGWKPDTKEISADEQARRAQVAEWRANQRRLDEEKERALAEKWKQVYAEFFMGIWSTLLGSIGPSEYIARKKVGCYGIRFPRDSFVIVTDTEEIKVFSVRGAGQIRQFFKAEQYKDSDRYSIRYIKRGTFLVPLFDLDGVIYNAQVIYASGKKSFFREAPKQGLFHLMGEPEPGKPIALTEGYATGATIRKATEWPCAIGFDVYNLRAVAQKLVVRYPESRLVICGDDDVDNKDNPGRTRAEALAKELNCRAVFPNFRATGK